MERADGRDLRLPGENLTVRLGAGSGVENRSFWGGLGHLAAARRSPTGRLISSSGSDDEPPRCTRCHGHVSAEAADRVPSPATSPGATLSWLGHSTVLIELDGVHLITDPVLRHRIGHLVRIAPDIGTNEVGAVDCVLLSHLHADHADIRTLRELRRTGPIIAPASAQRWLTRHGLRSISVIGVGEDAAVGPVGVTAIPARHAGRRWPVGPAGASLGFVIKGSSSIYFAGDTDLFPAMADLRGSVDVALLPVSGWGPNVGEGHLDPERAARAVALIEPAVAIPIHWGTYALPWRIRTEGDPVRPAREFAALTRRLVPGVEVRLLAPGGVTRV